MADGSVTIEINGDASEVINSFKQVSSAAEALANNLKGITGSFETVSSASRGMSEGISGSLGDIDTYLNEIDASLNELNNDPFSTAADGAQNLGNSLNDMDSYLDDLESSFDELRNDPFSTNSDGADHLREDLDRLGDAADDAGDQMDEAGGSASKFSEIFKGTFMGNLAAKGVELAVEAVKKLGEAMIDVGKQAIESYASYEQLTGGMDTLFKSSSGKMKQYAAEAYKTAGMSANEYMETATSFAATLITSVGGDTEKAAEQANKAIIQMSDNANKMGTSLESIQDAYRGFAKENYTINLMSAA